MDDMEDIDGKNDMDDDDVDVLGDWGLDTPTVTTRQYVERRKKTDWVVRAVTIIAALGWFCALAALLFIQRARPVEGTFVTLHYGQEVVGYWSSSLLRGAFVATLVSFATCVVGFILNATRHRRKTDRFNKLLIGVSIASAVILVVYLVNFSSYL